MESYAAASIKAREDGANAFQWRRLALALARELDLMPAGRPPAHVETMQQRDVQAMVNRQREVTA